MQKKLIFSFLLISSCLSYDLVWSDEFDGTSLDTSSWNVEVTDKPNNNELEAYTANNFYVQGGYLHIVAKRENWGSKQYTSGRINTQDKRDFLYGKFEARMKMPIGKGMWPAFWLMPTDKGSQWPSTGEIDIMETIGSDPTNSHATIHYGYSVQQHQWKGDPVAVPGGYSSDFHVYSCEWEPGKITFYLDGKLFSTRTSQECQPWPFDEGNKFYVILNLAVGGDWPGSPDGSTVFPSEFVIDYVRIYQGSSGSSGMVLVDSDIQGTPIANVQRSSWADCFMPCYETAGCQSFSWNNYNGGTCWLKSTSDRNNYISNPGVYAAFLCNISQNKDISENDLQSVSASDPRQCCGACAALEGCGAFSWNSWNGGTCYLKSGGSLIDKSGVSAWTFS